MKVRAEEAVTVKGLTELQAGLREIDKTMPRRLTKTNKTAAEIVAVAARARAESLGGVAAKSAPSIKAAGEQKFAKVNLGGPAFPFALGANFGAVHDKLRNTTRGTMLGWNQFKPPEKDYFLYWSIRSTRAVFLAEYERLIAKISADAFPDGSHAVEVT